MPTLPVNYRVLRRAVPALVAGTALWLGACSQGSSADKPAGEPGRARQGEPAAASTPDKPPPSKTVVIWRGHQTLYNEGWFVVTSSRDALTFAREHGIASAGEALAEARKSIAAQGAALPERMGQGIREGVATGAAVHAAGRRGSAALTRTSDELAARQRGFAQEQVQRAGSFVTGGVYYGKRTPEHWQRLKSTWPQWYGDLSQDFSNVHEINRRVADRIRTRMEADWDGSWKEATVAFKRRYEASGEAPNSLVALGDLLAGYWQALVVGVAEPSGRTAVVGTVAGVRAVTYVFTPAADSVLLAGRTVQASGLSVYYAAQTTVDVLSPSVEAGFLTGLGLLAYGSSGVTYVGGQGLGLVNQVAVSTAAVGAGAAQAGALAATDAGKFVALVTYDLAKGATKVVIHEAQAGAVLGYNALTAIPTHVALGALDAVYLLVSEGSTLMVVRVTEEPKPGKPPEAALKLANLPVGTVVDVKKLKEQEGVRVEVLTDDPEETHRVLEQVEADARVP